MAERRMLSKTISTSRKVNRLTDRAGLLYTWLIPHTDDYGRMEGDVLTIKAKVVPMRQITAEEVEQDLMMMSLNGLIKTYQFNDETYLEILNFESFQTFKTDRPRRSDYPDENGNIPSGIQRFPTGNIVLSKGREGKGSKDKGREDIYPDDFISFWTLYPKKVGKPKTYAEWKSISKVNRSKILEDIPKRMEDEKWVGGFIKDPERYLKHQQWEDEIIKKKGSQTLANNKFKKLGL